MTEEKIPGIEIVGETCAKPLPKKKKVYSSDGKSMWLEEIKKKIKNYDVELYKTDIKEIYFLNKIEL